jgi:alkylmercury lyase
MEKTERIERLTDQLIGAVPKLNRAEQKVALAVVRALACGESVSDQSIAETLPATAGAIREMVAAWPGVFRDEHDRMIGFMGLSVVEFGDHRIHLGDRTLSAWCAWDTLFLPELLGDGARVSSRCPTTGRDISLTVTPQGPGDIKPNETVLSFLAPERPFDGDVIRRFCHFVHFFPSEGAAAEWTEQNPGTFTLSIEQGFRLGQLTNGATFGSALSDEASRHNRERHAAVDSMYAPERSPRPC